MKVPKIEVQKTALLLVALLILTLLSLVFLLYAHQLPTHTTKTVPTCLYTQETTYNYTAQLAPNTIYNNKTTLKTGEGLLYTRITKAIEITLNYVFRCSVPANTQIRYSITTTLESPERWVKTVEQRPPVTLNSTTFRESFKIDTAQIREMARQLDEEVGTTSSTYSFSIKPEIHVTADTQVGLVNEEFTPVLTLQFNLRTEKGEYIGTDGLVQTKTGSLTRTVTEPVESTPRMRQMSYVALAATTAALAVTTYFYREKPRPPRPKRPGIEKVIAPYKDLIVETEEPPRIPPESTVVDVRTIEEMAKTAEILAKPMILVRRPEPTLTIIDQNMAYQHRIRRPKAASNPARRRSGRRRVKAG